MAIVLYLYKISKYQNSTNGSVEEVFEQYRQRKGDKFFDSHICCFKRMYDIFEFFKNHSELDFGKVDLAFVNYDTIDNLLDKLQETLDPIMGNGFQYSQWLDANYGVEKNAKKMLRKQITLIKRVLKHSSVGDKFIILNA